MSTESGAAPEQGGHASVKTYVLVGVILTITRA